MERLLSYFNPPDNTLIEVAAGGEYLAALLRLIIVGFVWICIAIVTLTMAIQSFQFQFGFAIASVALCLSIVIFLASKSRKSLKQRQYFICFIDVSLISAALLAFVIAGRPDIAINSMVYWDIYLIFIIATCLYMDARISLFSGLLAVTQYTCILLWVTSHWDMNNLVLSVESHVFVGIDWPIQICRIMLMLCATAVAIGLVIRSQNILNLSGIDSLTGLENRRVFSTRLEHELSRANRENLPMAVAYLDLDHFKTLNDNYGHDAGDQALKHFANIIKQHIRRGDILARWGGEEFIVLFWNTDKHRAKTVLNRTLRYFKAKPFILENRKLYLSFSAGVSEFALDSSTSDELIEIADQRLRQAKENGRQQIIITDS